MNEFINLYTDQSLNTLNIPTHTWLLTDPNAPLRTYSVHLINIYIVYSEVASLNEERLQLPFTTSNLPFIYKSDSSLLWQSVYFLYICTQYYVHLIAQTNTKYLSSLRECSVQMKIRKTEEIRNLSKLLQLFSIHSWNIRSVVCRMELEMKKKITMLCASHTMNNKHVRCVFPSELGLGHIVQIRNS